MRSSSSKPFSKPLLKIELLLFVMLALLLFILVQKISYAALFGTFALYDDEGYALISIKSFLQGNALYDATFSQYGPFYYVINELLYRLLKIPLNHNNSRLVTLVCWSLTTVVTMFYTYKMTRNYWLSLVIYWLSWWHLFTLINEPTHPQQFCILLISLLPLMALINKSPQRLLGLTLVALALLFIKINLGIYSLVAILLFIFLVTPNEDGNTKWAAMGKILLNLLILMTLLLPVMLMKNHLSTSWGRNYCLLTTLGMLPLLHLLYQRNYKPTLPKLWIQLTYIIVPSLLVTLVLIGYTYLHGTSFSGIVNGGVLQHLTFSKRFFSPLTIDANALLIALVGLLLYLLYASKNERFAPYFNIIFLVTKIVLAITGLTLCLLGYAALMLNYAPCFLWIVLILPGSAKDKINSENIYLQRVCLALVACLQLLHAYPVAGSQQFFATFLLLPISAIFLQDAFSDLAELMIESQRESLVKVIKIVGIMASLGFIGWQVNEKAPILERYQTRLPINVAGAERLHISEQALATYQFLIENSWLYADRLMTYPGMYSFNFWTEKDPPSALNGTNWIVLLNMEQQQRVADQLKQFPQLCVIKNMPLFQLGLRDQPPINSPLVNYLDKEFTCMGKVGNYQFCVRNGRKIELTYAAFWTYGISSGNTGGNAETRAPKSLYQIILQLPALGDKTVYNFTLENLGNNSTVFDSRKDASWITDEGQEETALPNSSFNGINLVKPHRLLLQSKQLNPNIDGFLVVHLLDKEDHNIASIPFLMAN